MPADVIDALSKCSCVACFDYIPIDTVTDTVLPSPVLGEGHPGAAGERLGGRKAQAGLKSWVEVNLRGAEMRERVSEDDPHARIALQAALDEAPHPARAPAAD